MWLFKNEDDEGNERICSSNGLAECEPLSDQLEGQSKAWWKHYRAQMQ